MYSLDDIARAASIKSLISVLFMLLTESTGPDSKGRHSHTANVVNGNLLLVLGGFRGNVLGDLWSYQVPSTIARNTVSTSRHFITLHRSLEDERNRYLLECRVLLFVTYCRTIIVDKDVRTTRRLKDVQKMWNACGVLHHLSLVVLL